MAAAIARANVDHIFGRISLLTGESVVIRIMDPNAAASRRATPICEANTAFE
jgi:hypothetical protein